MVSNTNDTFYDLVKSRAIVVDEKKMVAEGLQEMLLSTAKFDTVKNFCSITEASREMTNNCYDFLFTDMVIQDTDANEFICEVKSKWPQVKIVVVTVLCDVHAARRAFAAGANSFLTKNAGKTELEMAIEKNMAGEKYISVDLLPKFAISAAENYTGYLTKREIEILKLVAQGMSIAKAASIMHLSHHTIITHRRNIMQKLNMHSAVEMARYAYANNYLSVS